MGNWLRCLLLCVAMAGTALAQDSGQSEAAAAASQQPSDKAAPLVAPVSPAASVVGSQGVSRSPQNIADPMTVVAGLLLTVLLIFACAWVIRRMGAVSAMGGRALKVVAALSLGTREKVVLVQVGEQQLLLGVAPGRISHLHTLEQSISNDAAASGEFGLRLRQMLAQNKPQAPGS